MADARAPLLLGQPGAALGGVPARRLLRGRLGRLLLEWACPGLLTPGLRQPGQRAELLLGNAVPSSWPDHDREPLGDRRPALLPGQLRADPGRGGRGLLPRPVPPEQSAAL